MDCSHALRVTSLRNKLSSILHRNDQIDLDGSSLDILQVVAIARFGKSASIDRLPEDVAHKVDQSVQFLGEELARGRSVYGVTTGFGGSADTTTTATAALQVALLQMQTSAVLPVHAQLQSNHNTYAALAMPEDWVRGAMLVRCNSLLRGHSAVRLDVVKTLLALLENDVIPLIPLRGSISASGDLCPLSYLAGALEGNPDVRVWIGPRPHREIISSDVALRRLDIDPIQFEPKEILGILNGTTISASVAGLAQHKADNMMVLAQVLTAMCVEALHGSVESFDPSVADVRPHRGQREIARNVSAFLQDSLLAKTHAGTVHEGDLRQDRYALRTAPQWLGPYIEDLLLAREQLEIELNSTTDNPLINASSRNIHHGGNFQAASITSSTEKTRLALQMIGKLIFAQSSELLNVHMNNGLPPNLAADEPSLSFTFKGVDINMAAYMSELAFLANPVSSHVQTAEMANQALNSLALISARYTHMALDVLSLMSSAHLYSLCQALDLRAMNARFLQQAKPAIERLVRDVFAALERGRLDAIAHSIWSAIKQAIASTISKDTATRFVDVAQSAHTPLLAALPATLSGPAPITAFTSRAAKLLESLFLQNRAAYMMAPDATPFLGLASRRMYTFVRKELGVPFHRGLVDHPTNLAANLADEKDRQKLRTIGGHISVIYAALTDERLMEPVVDCVEEAFSRGEARAAAKL
ncbi:hypothetical protein BDW71DRAFT_213315 [Aspergillus fruticulosus]